MPTKHRIKHTRSAQAHIHGLPVLPSVYPFKLTHAHMHALTHSLT